MAHPESVVQDELEAGLVAGRRWVSGPSGERERSTLAALFAGGLNGTILTSTTFPTLIEALSAQGCRANELVDFSATPWLTGFRNAVVGQIGSDG
jgi:hypothetical protein